MWGWHNRGCLLNGPATKTGPMRGKDSRQVKTRKVCHLCAAECRTFDHAQDKNWERKKREKMKAKYQEYWVPPTIPSRKLTGRTWVQKDRENIVDRGKNTERWKAVRSIWDGSSKIKL